MTQEKHIRNLESRIEDLEAQVDQLKHAEKINYTLFDISNAVNTTTNLQDLYKSIHQSLNRLIYLPNIYISIYSKEDGTLRFPYCRDEMESDSYADIRIFKKDSLTGQVILSKEPIFLNQSQIIKRANQGGLVGSVPKVWLGVPLIAADKVIGALAVQSYTDAKAFTRKDLDVLVSVSNQIALAIERKRTNEALSQSELRYRTLSEKSHDIIMRFDKEGRHIYVNPAIKILGVKPEQIIGKTYEELHFPKTLTDQLKRSIDRVFQTGTVERSEFKLPVGKWIDWLLCPEFSSNDEVLTVITFARDITKKKELEYQNACFDRINKIIIDSVDLDQMLNNILDVMIDVFDCDRSWLLHPLDPKAKSYSMPFLRSKPEWFRKKGHEIVITKEVSDGLRDLLASDMPLVFDKASGREVRQKVRQASFVKSYIIMPIFPKLGKPWAAGLHQCSHDRIWTDEDCLLFNGICQRIADGLNSLLLYRELNRTKNYVDNVINSMPSMLMGVDPDGRITHWNLQAQTQTGLLPSNVIGRPFFDVLPHLKGFNKTIQTAINRKKVIEKNKIPRQVDKKLVYENITIYPLKGDNAKGAVIRMDEVTDQIKMEEMMIQSEKMLSVGGLAAGMAHEINNPLAGMMQNAQVVLNRLKNDLPANRAAAQKAGISLKAITTYMDDRGILDQLDHINEAGGHAAKIVQNMLSFAQKGKGAKIKQDVTKLLDMTIDLAKNDYDLKKRFDFKQIRIHREIVPGFPDVMCEPSKIQQVFLNIIKNSTEAMVEFNTQMDRQPAFFFNFYTDDKTAIIEIADNGPGMEENIKKRIFEPFYTTKSPDMGTGLGLSVAYFIVVEDHNGELKVESTPNKGSKFIIKLPI